MSGRSFLLLLIAVFGRQARLWGLPRGGLPWLIPDLRLLLDRGQRYLLFLLWILDLSHRRERVDGVGIEREVYFFDLAAIVRFKGRLHVFLRDLRRFRLSFLGLDEGLLQGRLSNLELLRNIAQERWDR